MSVCTLARQGKLQAPSVQLSLVVQLAVRIERMHSSDQLCGARLHPANISLCETALAKGIVSITAVVNTVRADDKRYCNPTYIRMSVSTRANDWHRFGVFVWSLLSKGSTPFAEISNTAVAAAAIAAEKVSLPFGETRLYWVAEAAKTVCTPADTCPASSAILASFLQLPLPHAEARFWMGRHPYGTGRGWYTQSEYAAIAANDHPWATAPRFSVWSCKACNAINMPEHQRYCAECRAWKQPWKTPFKKKGAKK